MGSGSFGFGFENPYEESKYDAELAVHEWSREHGRPALVFRPSVLVTDQPTPPGGARNPVLASATIADVTERLLVPNGTGGARLPLRFVAEPDAHLNLIPVELAARLMVEMAGRVEPSGVCTAHITYPHEVGIESFVAIVEQRYPVRVELVAHAPSMPSPVEALTADRLRSFMPFGFHHRHYDRGAMRHTGLDLAEALPLEPDYVLAGLSRRS